MKRPDATLSVLRTLDPADREIDPRGPRARADLARIIATDPQPAGHPGPARARGATPRGTRWLLAAGGAIAVTAAVGILIPSNDQAFASWTPNPAAMAPKEAAKAAKSCRGQQEGVMPDADRRLAAARPAVTEQRGDWTMVVLAGEQGFSAMCLTNDNLGLFANAWIGSIGLPDDFRALAPRELRATDLGTGTVANGLVSAAVGYAGPDVVGVTYPSAEHGPVNATVSGGRFALWFPGDEFENASRDGVQAEVTYRDGTSGTVTLRLD
ncbi:hypothetical protein Vqi01_47070 [Micromonospora qiuiae]|uniref:Uncharacterized protein n=1 Tax=Micromonospora qiuiae TaxID=502268 RepID=A0ABQ4JGB8_9ACTN|nr:hypothetical protein [Micromonospora qiuiae]GIJ29545.1 hypothetical protein Vqi01_47070 [Micromonospora qiuiae]